jgi:hypothetical protein
MGVREIHRNRGRNPRGACGGRFYAGDFRDPDCSRLNGPCMN